MRRGAGSVSIVVGRARRFCCGAFWLGVSVAVCLAGRFCRGAFGQAFLSRFLLAGCFCCGAFWPGVSVAVPFGRAFLSRCDWPGVSVAVPFDRAFRMPGCPHHTDHTECACPATPIAPNVYASSRRSYRMCTPNVPEKLSICREIWYNGIISVYHARFCGMRFACCRTVCARRDLNGHLWYGISEIQKSKTGF